MTIWNCHQLRRINAIDFNATVRFDRLNARSKNAILYALRHGWIRSSWHAGAGMIAHKLMVQAGVFFVATRLRKGQNKWNNYQYVDWQWRLDTPGWFVDKLQPVFTADRTAAAVANVAHMDHDFRPSARYVPFYVLKLQDHLPGVFASYVATPEYQAAVAPLIRLVEEGGSIDVNVAPPTGRSWRN